MFFIPTIASVITETYLWLYNPTDGRLFGLAHWLKLPLVKFTPVRLFTANGMSVYLPHVVNFGIFAVWGAIHSLTAQPWVQTAIYNNTPKFLRNLLFPSLDRVFSVIAGAATLPLMMFWQTHLGEDGVLWQLPLPGWLYTYYPIPRIPIPADILVCDVITMAITVYIFSVHVQGALDELSLPTRADVMLRGQQNNANQQRHLVTTGYHGAVRHPLYSFLLLTLLLTPRMATQRLWLMIDYLAYLVVAVPLEEKRCVKEFGQAYIDYRKKVPYQFIPYVW